MLLLYYANYKLLYRNLELDICNENTEVHK